MLNVARAVVVSTAIALSLAAAGLAAAWPRHGNDGAQHPSATHRTLLFASDGMRPDLMPRYARGDAMPTYARLMREGVTGANGLTRRSRRTPA